MNSEHLGTVIHCVICTAAIPPHREERGSNTCSDACARKRRLQQRAREDARACRYCKKPTTLEERSAFARFRAMELISPDLLYPKSFEQHIKNGGTLESFVAAIREFDLNNRDNEIAAENPIFIDMQAAKERMHRRKKKKEEAEQVCGCGALSSTPGPLHSQRCPNFEHPEGGDGEPDQQAE